MQEESCHKALCSEGDHLSLSLSLHFLVNSNENLSVHVCIFPGSPLDYSLFIISDRNFPGAGSGKLYRNEEWSRVFSLNPVKILCNSGETSEVNLDLDHFNRGQPYKLTNFY